MQYFHLTINFQLAHLKDECHFEKLDDLALCREEKGGGGGGWRRRELDDGLGGGLQLAAVDERPPPPLQRLAHPLAALLQRELARGVLLGANSMGQRLALFAGCTKMDWMVDLLSKGTAYEARLNCVPVSRAVTSSSQCRFRPPSLPRGRRRRQTSSRSRRPTWWSPPSICTASEEGALHSAAVVL